MKPLTRFLTLLTLPLTLMLSPPSLLPAHAAGKFFTQQEFDTLHAEGKTIIVHVHADWCGICKAQDVEVNAAMNAPAFKDVVFFEVNFDSQRKAVKFFNSKVQSVLIIFKQGKEIDRTVAIRDPGELQTFLRQALP
ncbi:MAG: hypothetical protein RL001_524 [Pseudomonadota bacterium]|jgi:thioredoxin 1